ncbi:MAG: dynamin family protein [Candidatus Acidiferrales bacterium]|jgi:small GTP-binding protein
MTEGNTSPSSGTSGLNEFQARRVRIACQYIDRLLGDIEAILNGSASKSPFPRYLADVAPVQRKTIEDYIARLRAQLVRVLDGQEIAEVKPSIPASRAIRVTLSAIDIAAEELKPQYMRGYGDVSDELATQLNGISGELRSLASRLDRYLCEGADQDLRERLKRLEDSGNDTHLLSRIERIVAERGLVEFRGAIASILSRAEDNCFEIAVFGRVSSGKSSLLNAMLGSSVLPVGVTPVTSVPTHIQYGEVARVVVSFAEAPITVVGIEKLADFAAEQQNPGNAKRVTKIVVALPSDRLRNGVSFVDTPGVGSLATRGTSETLAYLPKCDLGVLLIDAGSTLTSDDLQTIRALQEAAVPIQILLSKSDLLNPADREKVVQYVRQNIASECGTELPVFPVSVVSSNENLLSRWFEQDISPLYDRSKELKAASLRRKIGALSESVIVALKSKARRGGADAGAAKRFRDVEGRLRGATGMIEEASAQCRRQIEGIVRGMPDIFRRIASDMVAETSQKTAAVESSNEVLRASISNCLQEELKVLQSELENLTLRLKSDLAQCAIDLGMADSSSADDIQSIVRGMPVFDPIVPGDLSVRPGYSFFLGKSFAKERIARRIRHRFGRQFEQAFMNYVHVLEEWTRLVIVQVGRRFETYAEQYRAQAERGASGSSLPDDEIRAIEADLESLGAPVDRRSIGVAADHLASEAIGAGNA